MTGYCGCRLKFKVKLLKAPEVGQPVTFEVISEGNFRLVQTKFCGRALRGEERMKIGEQLVHNMPSKVLCEHTSIESPLHLLHNTTKLHSLEMLQQLRHEYLKKGSICLDPMSDLIAFKKETEELEKEASCVKGFIHLIKESQDNIQIHMYNEMALRLLQSSQRAGSSVLYVDATGSLTFPVNNKQMLFYLAFLETSKGHISPIASSLAHRGRAIDIADLFIKVKGDLKQMKKDNNKPLAGIIVTDFSFAMLNGVLQGANVMELRDYLQHSSNVIMDKTSFDPLRSVVFICTSHLIHSFSRLLRKHVPSTKEYTKIRKLAMHSIARLQACQDFPDYRNTVTCIIESFGNEFVNKDKIEKNIAFLMGEMEIDDTQEPLESSNDDIVDFNEHDLLREKSPFYQEFLKIKSVTNLQQHNSEEKNPFFHPGIVEIFEKYYCPYFPLFSAAILAKSGRYHKGTLTNGMVESEFNQIKTFFHQKQKVPFNMFIRKHYTYFTGRVRQVLLPDSHRRTRIQKRLKRGENRYDITTPEERWSKKRRNAKNFYVKKSVFRENTNGKPSLNATSIPTKTQALGIIQEQASRGKVQYYTPQAKDLIPGNSYRGGVTNADPGESDTILSPNAKLNAHSLGSRTTIKPQNPCKSTDVTNGNSDLASYTDLSKTPPKHDIDTIIPLDELARVPYSAARIDGQKFEKDTVSFRSKQLAELCRPKEWIDFDVMDRLLQYALTKNDHSKYTVSEVHFAWKQSIDNPLHTSDWHSLLEFDRITDEDSRCVDPRKSSYILHPLFVVNHYCLLEISKPDGKCTVYDSMDRSLGHLHEITTNVLPLFMLPNESIQWNTQYAHDFPIQHDSSSCGLYTYEACNLLIQGQTPCIKNLQHVRNARHARVKLVRELLTTTNEGRQILATVQDDDIRLERTLMILHNLREELVQKVKKQREEAEKQAKMKAAEESGDNVQKGVRKEKNTNDIAKEQHEVVELENEESNNGESEMGERHEKMEESQEQQGKNSAEISLVPVDDIRKQPFEEIYNVPATNQAGIEMLVSSTKGTNIKTKNKTGRRNIKELLRRFRLPTRKCGRYDLTDDQPMNFKEKVIPHYKEKQELFNKHCLQIRRIGLLEIRKLCEEILPEIRDIKEGKTPSQRDMVYRRSLVIDKCTLNKLAIVRAFSNNQDFEVGMYFDNMFDEGKGPCYANYVLKPEALIRIYAKTCNLPLKFAEKELLFGPDYDGDLPPE